MSGDAIAEICAVPHCSRPKVLRVWCLRHWRRWRRYGDPLAGPPEHSLPGEPEAWVKAHADWQGDECLNWPFGKSDGYAHLGRKGSACRLMCRLAHGEPPNPKDHAAHSCGKGHLGCINPKHLRWASNSENQADKILHGTSGRGEKNASAKLTAAEVISIRADRRRPSKIAADYGIAPQSVTDIKRRRRWKHLDDQPPPPQGLRHV